MIIKIEKIELVNAKIFQNKINNIYKNKENFVGKNSPKWFNKLIKIFNKCNIKFCNVSKNLLKVYDYIIYNEIYIYISNFRYHFIKRFCK